MTCVVTCIRFLEVILQVEFELFGLSINYFTTLCQHFLMLVLIFVFKWSYLLLYLANYCTLSDCDASKSFKQCNNLVLMVNNTCETILCTRSKPKGMTLERSVGIGGRKRSNFLMIQWVILTHCGNLSIVPRLNQWDSYAVTTNAYHKGFSKH